MTRTRFWVTFTIALTTFAALPALAQPGCSVQDGNFKHVWGGLIRDVFVLQPHPNAAWLLEDGGRIRATFNGGATWRFQKTPACVQDLLRGAHFLHGGPVREGWAVGYGVVLHTDNAGSNWRVIAQPMALGKGANLWDVHFLNQSVGFIAGKHVLRSSTDGGVTWNDVNVIHPNDPSFQLSDHEYYTVDFQQTASGLVGIAVAEPGLILRTTDGFNWTVVWDFCFAPPLCSTCAPVAPNPPVAGCTNAFEIWDVEIVPGAASPTSAEIIASGGFGNQCGQFLVSANGGQSWSQEFELDGICNQSASCPGAGTQDGVPTQYGIHALTPTGGHSSGGGISVGYGGTNIVRDVACSPQPVWRANPQIVESGTNMKLTQPLFSVDGSDTGRAYMGSMFNGIARSDNGGASWTVQSVANDVFRLKDVFFADATTGWAVGQQFRITKTTDGGSNWTTEQLPTGPAGQGGLNDIIFDAGGQNGVAVGGFFNSNAPKISVTATGGPSWADHQSITPPLGSGDRTLSAVTTTGNAAFWAVGARGTVLFSTDGGNNWQNVGVNLGGGPIANVTLNGVAFSDPDTGYVVGRQGATGKIYRVTNATNPATRAWADVSPATAATDLQGVATGAGNVWAVGKRLGMAGDEVAAVYGSTGGAFSLETTPKLDPCQTVNPTAGSPFRALAGLYNEVAVAPSGTSVLVGGSCGRFVRRDAQGTWTELASQTSMHISGMSFFAGDQGFVHATLGSHDVIVKYVP